MRIESVSKVYNLVPDKESELLCLIRSAELSTMIDRVLTAYAITAHTPFERLDVVCLVPFQGAQFDGDTLSTQLPPKSVLMLEIS